MNRSPLPRVPMLYQVTTAPDRSHAVSTEIARSDACWPLGDATWLVSTGETLPELRARLGAVAERVRVSAIAPNETVAPGDNIWAWLSEHQ